MNRAPHFSVIVPVYNAPRELQECLGALRKSTWRDFEAIVVDDGSTEPLEPIARRHGCRYLRIDGPGGPARARNQGAAVATGRHLVFVDADVCVHPDTLERFAAAFAREPPPAAVVGTYDAAPAAPGFLSEYKNLFHRFVHTGSDGEIPTFWSGCGGVARDVFAAFGGFDEKRYRRPAIEDIELGTWMSAAGHRIVLDSRVQCKHLKKWSLWSLVKTDLADRGIPWTRLMLRAGRMANTLNVTVSQRLSVALAGLALAACALALWWPGLLAAAGAAALAVTAINWRFYRFFIRERGLFFALRAVPFHWVYFVICGLSFALGALGYYFSPESRRPPALERAGTS